MWLMMVLSIKPCERKCYGSSIHQLDADAAEQHSSLPL